MSAAYYLRGADPGLKAAVLESEVIGYGASDRNESVAMTIIGLGLGVLAMLKGKESAREWPTHSALRNMPKRDG